jgi:Leucine-rich repeat (LRR) protein
VTSLALDAGGAEWIGALGELPRLEVLALAALEGFTSFEALPALPALHTILAPRCPHLRDLTGLDAQPALRSLQLSQSQVLKLATLPALPALRSLEPDDTQIADLAPLAVLPGLARLRLAGCRRVTELAPLASCTALYLAGHHAPPGGARGRAARRAVAAAHAMARR